MRMAMRAEQSSQTVTRVNNERSCDGGMCYVHTTLT